MRDSFRRAATATIAITIALAPSLLVAETPPSSLDVVRLRSGAFYRGTIVEYVPGDHVTLTLPTGATQRFAWADVEAATPIAAPSSAASAPVTAGAPASSAPTAAPIPSAPASAPASAASSTPPVASARPPAAPAAAERPVRVHLYSTAPGTWLEVRPRQEKTVPWRRACIAPCDESVDLEGQELRAAGDAVTPSNPIRVEGGAGTLRLSVDAGSARARSLGLTGVFVGVPVAMAGGAVFGVAKTTDVSHADTLATTGLVTVVVGAVMALASLPLLVAGTTTVRNEAGTVVGGARGPTFTY